MNVVIAYVAHMSALEWISWAGTFLQMAGAFFVAHGTQQRAGYVLFFFGIVCLVPILLASHIFSQVMLQIYFTGVNLYGLWRRRNGARITAPL